MIGSGLGSAATVQALRQPLSRVLLLIKCGVGGALGTLPALGLN